MYYVSLFHAAPVTFAPQTGEDQATLPISQSYAAKEFLSSCPTVSSLLPEGENYTITTALLWKPESLAFLSFVSASQT